MFSRRGDYASKMAWNLALYSLFSLLSLSFNYAEAKQQVLRDYEYLDSKDIYDLSVELALKYSDLVTLTTAQDRFGLRAAGTDADCPFEKDVIGCSNWILTIQDNVLYPPGSDESLALPEVLLSGALHGNERVGPTAVMEYAALLLDSADCESYPRINKPDETEPEIVKDEYVDQLKQAKECHHDLFKRGVKNKHVRWLARLVSTRRIVIVPTANSLGYFRNEMGEDGIDPNVDFPFHLTPVTNVTCMQTIAARTMNELFRSHVFQIGLNFHAGVSGIGYSWGTPSFEDSISPDAIAQIEIAKVMSTYAGTGSNDKLFFPTGQINDIASPSEGNMEDWAYAGGWAQDKARKCTSTSYGNYEGPVTQPTDESNRALTFYIGTSNDLEPPQNDLGSDDSVFFPNRKKVGSGRIARLLRIALLATDIAEPYVSIKSVGGDSVSDDIVPLRAPARRSCIYTKSFQVPAGNDVKIKWQVGGAFEVEDTMLVYGKWSDFPEDVDGFSQPLSLVDMITSSKNLLQQNNLYVAYAGSGPARWNKDTEFSLKIPIDQFEKGDLLAVFAVAIVDKSWASQAEGNIQPPKKPPQSHLVNRRINPSWSKINSVSKKHLVGQSHWFSIPLTLEIKKGKKKVKETSLRIPAPSLLHKFENEFEEIEEDIEEDLFAPKTAFAIVGCMFILCVAITYLNEKRKKGFNVYGNVNTVRYYDDPKEETTGLQLS